MAHQYRVFAVALVENLLAKAQGELYVQRVSKGYLCGFGKRSRFLGRVHQIALVGFQGWIWISESRFAGTEIMLFRHDSQVSGWRSGSPSARLFFLAVMALLILKKNEIRRDVQISLGSSLDSTDKEPHNPTGRRTWRQLS